MKKLSLVLLVSLLFSSAQAQVAQVDPNRTSGGQAREFTNREFKPSAKPLPLPKIQDLDPTQKKISDQANDVLQRNASLGILLIDRGRIVFEGYRKPASEKTFQFSMSMSKSLTAYTIGSVFCAGKISSLDDTVSKYAPELKGTVYGDASIKNLLTMSSGVQDLDSNGSHYFEEFADLRGHKISVTDLLHKFPNKKHTPGKFFRYSNSDTASLALVADGAGGFLDSYEKNIWNRAGTESSGYWLIDKQGRAISAYGVSATMRDWARLAILTINELKSGSDCMKTFMQDATKKQLPNIAGRTGRAFGGYGYQTWTNLGFGSGRGYWWVGYGGQRVGIDPETERIIVVSSWREDYMEEVYRLFADFQNMR